MLHSCLPNWYTNTALGKSQEAHWRGGLGGLGVFLVWKARPSVFGVDPPLSHFANNIGCLEQQSRSPAFFVWGVTKAAGLGSGGALQSLSTRPSFPLPLGPVAHCSGLSLCIYLGRPRSFSPYLTSSCLSFPPSPSVVGRFWLPHAPYASDEFVIYIFG